MDFQTKKFWTFIGLVALMIIGVIMGKVDFMTGLEWIMATAAAWGILDTASKFAKKGDTP